ncbi:uncharacterized protein LOC141927701 [Strix aluco]|uniref:uncharacterized protein LOC141927701 n=1 Tax=Strix aluco TaxID=111821 RepID=UPI003DA4EEDC
MQFRGPLIPPETPPEGGHSRGFREVSRFQYYLYSQGKGPSQLMCYVVVMLSVGQGALVLDLPQEELRLPPAPDGRAAGRGSGRQAAAGSCAGHACAVRALSLGSRSAVPGPSRTAPTPARPRRTPRRHCGAPKARRGCAAGPRAPGTAQPYPALRDSEAAAAAAGSSAHAPWQKRPITAAVPPRAATSGMRPAAGGALVTSPAEALRRHFRLEARSPVSGVLRVSVTCQIKKMKQPIHTKPDKYTRSPLHHKHLAEDVHSGVSSHAQNTTHPVEKSMTAVYCIS